MDEMNESDIARELDREVSDRTGLIQLSICLGAVAVVLVAGAMILFRQFS